MQAIEKAGYKPGEDIMLALDVASSEFYKNGMYELTSENKKYTNNEFIELINSWTKSYPIISVEDALDENDWDALIQDFKNVVRNKTKKDFPQNVFDQLYGAISAVFLSWESHRAKVVQPSRRPTDGR